MFQTSDNSQLCIDSQYSSRQLTFVWSLKHQISQPIYFFYRVRVLYLDRLKEGTWLHKVCTKKKVDWAKLLIRYSSKSIWVRLPKWSPHGRIILANGQLDHSYTFWTNVWFKKTVTHLLLYTIGPSVLFFSSPSISCHHHQNYEQSRQKLGILR